MFLGKERTSEEPSGPVAQKENGENQSELPPDTAGQTENPLNNPPPPSIPPPPQANGEATIPVAVKVVCSS